MVWIFKHYSTVYQLCYVLGTSYKTRYSINNVFTAMLGELFFKQFVKIAKHFWSMMFPSLFKLYFVFRGLFCFYYYYFSLEFQSVKKNHLIVRCYFFGGLEDWCSNFDIWKHINYLKTFELRKKNFKFGPRRRRMQQETFGEHLLQLLYLKILIILWQTTFYGTWVVYTV